MTRAGTKDPNAAKAIADEVRSSFGKRNREDEQNDLDRRLRRPNVEGLRIQVVLRDGSKFEADVFSLTRSDLIVRFNDDELPVPEPQAIKLAFLDGEFTDQFEGLIHWEGTAGNQRLLGIFAAESLPASVMKFVADEQCREIRFPIDLKAVVRGNLYHDEAKIVDYSLNGLGLKLSKPMELDQRYEATTMLNGQIIRLPMLCCFNMRTAEGYFAGVGLRCLEGALLTYRAYQPIGNNRKSTFLVASTRFPALNHINGRGRAPEYLKTNTPTIYERFFLWFDAAADNVDEKLNDRPVISRAAILILSAILIGMSIFAFGDQHQLFFFNGLIGMIAYFGLNHAAWLADKRHTEEAARMKREIAERRLAVTGTRVGTR